MKSSGYHNRGAPSGLQQSPGPTAGMRSETTLLPDCLSRMGPCSSLWSSADPVVFRRKVHRDRHVRHPSLFGKKQRGGEGVKPTLRQTYSWPEPRVQFAFKDSMIHIICNSHYVSHFAAFFIDTGAKTSIVESCHWFRDG